MMAGTIARGGKSLTPVKWTPQIRIIISPIKAHTRIPFQPAVLRIRESMARKYLVKRSAICDVDVVLLSVCLSVCLSNVAFFLCKINEECQIT